MIDSHVHFWNFDPVRDNWITGEMKPIQRDFLPNDLIEAIDEHQTGGCIAVQASQQESENFFLLKLANENQLIKGIVGWVDLCDPHLEERLTWWKSQPAIKGWRHVLQAETDDFILSESLIAGIKTLKNYDYTYDLLCYHAQLPAIIKLVEQVPGQRFVLDHCGKPDLRKNDLKPWTENIRELAQHENVHCKISGLLTEADWKNWDRQQIFNCLDVVMEYFGPEKVMYGSDWPVMTLSRPHNVWLNLIKSYLSQFDAKEQDLIMNKNAVSFYGL